MAFKRKPVDCSVCDQTFHDGKSFSCHLSTEHGLSREEYVVAMTHGGTKPTCAKVGCNAPTRFMTDRFRKYCRQHGSSCGGKIGGKRKRTWNKGKTKLDDPRIMSASLGMTGTGNPFYGRHRTEETRAQIADKKRLSYTKKLNNKDRIHTEHDED